MRELEGAIEEEHLARRIDAHQHFWNLDLVEYPWLGPDSGPIYRTYEPPELESQIRAAGIEATVVIQAADSYADTEYMLAQADAYPWIAGVVGWVPLLDPAEAERALDRFTQHPKFRGVRHLIHDEADPHWLAQEQVVEGLKLLAERDLVFDVVAVYPNHLEHVPTLAERVPDLRMVIDHLAKPPIKEGVIEPWAELMSTAASYPNVYAKVSGLNTAADPETWSAKDLAPYIERARELFGPERLMFGSDWPVCELAGTYAQVWEETNRAVESRPQAERDALYGGVAEKVYKL